MFGAICGVIGLCCAIIGGARWQALAKEFPVRMPYSGPRKKLRWFVVKGVCSMRNCGELGASADGLYLLPPSIFAVFLPPLQIPWSAIKNATKTETGLQFEVRDLSIAMPADALSADSLKLLTVREKR